MRTREGSPRDRGTQHAGRDRFFIEHLVQGFGDRGGLEGGAPGQQVIQRCPQAIDIAAAGDLAAPGRGLFRPST